jgi:hypothetical protein
MLKDYARGLGTVAYLALGTLVLSLPLLFLMLLGTAISGAAPKDNPFVIVIMGVGRPILLLAPLIVGGLYWRIRPSKYFLVGALTLLLPAYFWTSWAPLDEVMTHFGLKLLANPVYPLAPLVASVALLLLDPARLNKSSPRTP